MTANTQPCPTSPFSASTAPGYWAQGLPAAQLRRCIGRPAWLSKEATAWLECEKAVHRMGKMERLQRRNWDILPWLVGTASIVREAKNQLEVRHARGAKESKKSFYCSVSAKRLTKENAGLLQHGVGDTVTADPHHLFCCHQKGLPGLLLSDAAQGEKELPVGDVYIKEARIKSIAYLFWL